MYRAIKYSNTLIGEWIVIPGAGGGLGHLAVQYAASMGLRVLAIGELPGWSYTTSVNVLSDYASTTVK